MNPSSPSFSQPSTSTSDTLLLALFIAAVIHALILLGIGFSIPKPPKVNKQIEITLASTPAKKAPEKASYLAQDNQVGAGNKKKPTKPAQTKITQPGKQQQ